MEFNLLEKTEKENDYKFLNPKSQKDKKTGKKSETIKIVNFKNKLKNNFTLIDPKTVYCLKCRKNIKLGQSYTIRNVIAHEKKQKYLKLLNKI
jgi:hypothetical protein